MQGLLEKFTRELLELGINVVGGGSTNDKNKLDVTDINQSTVLIDAVQLNAVVHCCKDICQQVRWKTLSGILYQYSRAH